MTQSLEGHLLVATADLRDPNFARSVVLLIRHNEEGALGLILNRRTTATIRQVWEQVSDSACHSTQPLHLGGPVQGPLMALHAHPAGDWEAADLPPDDRTAADEAADDEAAADEAADDELGPDDAADDDAANDDAAADEESEPGFDSAALHASEAGQPLEFHPVGDDSPAEHEVLPGLYFSADPEHLTALVAAEDAQARYFVGYAGWGRGQLESELDQGSWLTAPATAEHVFCDEETAWQQITRHILGRQMIQTLNIKHVPKDPGMN